MSADHLDALDAIAGDVERRQLAAESRLAVARTLLTERAAAADRFAERDDVDHYADAPVPPSEPRWSVRGDRGRPFHPRTPDRRPARP